MKILPIMAASLFLLPAAYASQTAKSQLDDSHATDTTVRIVVSPRKPAPQTPGQSLTNDNGTNASGPAIVVVGGASQSQQRAGRHRALNTQDYDAHTANRGSIGGTDFVASNGDMGFLAMLRAGPDGGETDEKQDAAALAAANAASAVRTTQATPTKCVWWNPCTWCRSCS
jgi:hypothetical protein